MPLAVWADAVDVPTRVCADARLGGATSQPANPDGQLNGQGGWDIGLRFANLTDLAAQLEQLLVTLPSYMCTDSSFNWSWPPKWTCPAVGKVTRLAINAHGEPGRLYAGGTPDSNLTEDPRAERQAISVKNLPSMVVDLQRIHDATAPEATIFLMGCVAGQTTAGTELLKALSQLYWPDRRVVGFTTTGYQAGNRMLRPGNEICMEPGMRDTLDINQSAPASQASLDRIDLWNDLNMMPWASDTSPGAKIAENGQIIRQATIGY